MTRYDKDDPNIFHDQITVFDLALTRPWTVDKKYVRDPAPRRGRPVAWRNAPLCRGYLGTKRTFFSFMRVAVAGSF
jgi:hypothetical protein